MKNRACLSESFLEKHCWTHEMNKQPSIFHLLSCSFGDATARTILSTFEWTSIKGPIHSHQPFPKERRKTNGKNWDRTIEIACQLHSAIMTQHGLLHIGFHISWLRWVHWYKETIFWLDKCPNLGYADVKLNIACMHPLACLHTLSLCIYCDLYGSNPCSLSLT